MLPANGVFFRMNPGSEKGIHDGRKQVGSTVIRIEHLSPAPTALWRTSQMLPDDCFLHEKGV
jgi:hypothetical protein